MVTTHKSFAELLEHVGHRLEMDARRDANFKALQALRFNTFAVSQGRMVSV
jgi:hypothetical protein